MKVRLVQLLQKGKELKREKVKPIDDVDIDLDRKTLSVLAIKNDTILAKLVRAKVDSISLDGLFISGLEENFNHGAKEYYYQEWWCITKEI